jgi:hypothetical protein
VKGVDAALQASFTIARADAPMTFAWTIDDESPGSHSATIAAPLILPDGGTIFDHRAEIDRGRHTVQLWGRADRGVADLEAITIEFGRLSARDARREPAADHGR